MEPWRRRQPPADEKGDREQKEKEKGTMGEKPGPQRQRQRLYREKRRRLQREGRRHHRHNRHCCGSGQISHKQAVMTRRGDGRREATARRRRRYRGSGRRGKERGRKGGTRKSRSAALLFGITCCRQGTSPTPTMFCSWWFLDPRSNVDSVGGASFGSTRAGVSLLIPRTARKKGFRHSSQFRADLPSCSGSGVVLQ